MMLRVFNKRSHAVYQGSKWLKHQMLIDGDELKSLFDALGDFWIFPMTGVIDGHTILKEFFIEEYGRWIENLQKGKIPSPDELRRLLACVMTDDLESLHLHELSPYKYLLKIQKPVIQVQTHYFTYSPIDQVFRPMSMGAGSIFWGLQFSFPQIYQDPETMELRETKANPLFRKIQLWTREMTRATPFIADGKKVNVPIRLGKRCFSWIRKHPQLSAQMIDVCNDN